jgi:translation elongation factor EF-G
LDNALSQLHREDPSLRVQYDEETGQTILAGKI